MTSDQDTLWQTKLHARLHDPAEKALVLLRDPEGHEGGSSKVLHRLLGFQRIESETLDPDNDEVLHRAVFKHGIPADMYRAVRRADWWAAAADRPQWPMQEITVTSKRGEQKTFKVANGAQVRWTQKAILIHPLTGAEFDLGSLGDTDLEDLKSRCFRHTAALVQRTTDEQIDWRRTLFALWRFGPELREDEDNGKLGSLWPLLPADTRIPDHSIWDHLDLTSAFAGAFAADPQGEVALLTLSIGPVQSFIAAARSTSDLWAGSHLLARLAWEAMKPLCVALGPDAILFPRLRGVPQVDVWLRDELKLPAQLFEGAAWTYQSTDANPLFAAALPNRCVALVPASQARELALRVQRAVREWLQAVGKNVVDRLLDEAGLSADGASHAHGQMRQQLEGFPELHWAAVPFSLIQPRNAERQTDLDIAALSAAMAPFFGGRPGQASGFLDSLAWKLLQQDVRWDGNTVFWAPNPGALYPAVYDLAERAHAAAKAVRPFGPRPQAGWRCSLTGESEWLTTDPEQLKLPPGERRNTLWTRISNKRRAWAKEGEHLGALPAIKRLWPTLFAEEVGGAVHGDAGRSAYRFVVSTHTMSLAHQLGRWVAQGGGVPPTLGQALEKHHCEPVALPHKLMAEHGRRTAELDAARRLPDLLDAADDVADDSAARDLRSLIGRMLAGDAGKLETYYALLMMDGDRMGAWLNGGDDYAISYRQSFHPQTRAGFDEHARREPTLQRYGAQARAVSPNRHLSISAALNDFSLTVAPHVVEREFLGRLIYAGGDDVLAMLPVADLLPALQRLRVAYSGHDPEHQAECRDRQGLTLHQGFALLRERDRMRLMRMMGERATASAGAVVAHHQAPLGAVMRELRAAEQRAKNAGNRDAFCITVVKRSGGTLSVIAKWGEPARLLGDLRVWLAGDGVSRRAVYNSLDWIKDLPQDDPAMLAALLAYQLDRQAQGNDTAQAQAPVLAQRLAALAFDQQLRPAPGENEARLDWLGHFMGVAEFLARDTRSAD